MRPEHRFTFGSNLIIYGDNMNKIADVKKLSVVYITKRYSSGVEKWTWSDNINSR